MKTIFTIHIAVIFLLFAACSPNQPDDPYGGDGKISATNITTNALTLVWQTSTTPNNTTIQYTPFYSRGNNLYSIRSTEQFGIPGTVILNSNSCRITGLDMATRYYFNVIASANGGKTLYLTYSAFTADTNAPQISDDVKTLRILNDSLQLVWQHASDTTSPTNALSYRVYYSTNNDITNVAATLTNGTAATDWLVNTTNAAVTGLQASSRYYFVVLVKDQWGNIAATAPKERATPDSNNNYLINGSFTGVEGTGWLRGKNPNQSGAQMNSNKMYFHTDAGGTGWAQAYALQSVAWNEGEAAYAQYWIKPTNLPLTVNGFAYIKVQFRQNGSALRTYQNNMYPTEQYIGTIWINTPPAPAGTTHAVFQLGIYKSNGVGQMTVWADNAHLTIVTNK